MLALIAAVLFAIAFVLNAAAVSTSAVFSPFSLMLAGLALVALHLTGQRPAIPSTRRRRR
jgi:hypothetical protein